MSESGSKVLLNARENLDKLKRISYNVKTRIEPLRGYEDNGLSHDECQVLVRRDGIRSEVIGEYAAFDDQGQKVIESSRKIKHLKLQDQTIDLRFYHPKKKTMIAAIYFHNNVKPYGNGFFWNVYGSFLEGRLDGHELSIIDLMIASSDRIEFHGMDTVKDIPCYIFGAITDYGVLNIWISPDCQFNILKWRLINNRSNLSHDGKPLSSFGWFRNETREYIYDEIEKIDGYAIVTNGELRTQEDIVVNNESVNRILVYRTQRSNIKINPDFEAMGAFKIDLPEGTILLAKGGEYEEYQFVNGEIVPYVNPLHTVDDDLNLRIKKPNQSQENIK